MRQHGLIDDPILGGAADSAGPRRQFMLVDGWRLAVDVVEAVLAQVGRRPFLVIHAARMAEDHASFGHSVNVLPVCSSVRVIRGSGMLPHLPIQRRNLSRATSSRPHQPCCTGRPPEDRVRW